MQVFPTVRRRLGSGSILGTYFKFAPVGEGLAPQVSSREIAAGVFLSKPFGDTPVTFALDSANLDLTLEGFRFQSDSYSFGISVGF